MISADVQNMLVTELQDQGTGQKKPVPGQRVDPDPGDRADSKQTERGSAR
ncbi:hypothetical protein GCM10020254_87440 [Streptomyces goshikiensis]